MKFSRLIAKCLIGLFMLCATAGYSQGKNILHIWFDTITVHSVPTQVVMNCWYKIEAPKPYSFRGFDLRYAYEGYQIAPTTCFFDGTACENAGFHTYSQDAQTGTARVVVLSSTELNIQYPLLFSIAFQAKSTLNDTFTPDFIGLMEVFRCDLNADDGFDSIDIHNGWIKYVKLVEPPPPPPEKKKAVEISSDSVTIFSDSTKIVHVLTSSLDSARIKRGVFSFNVDTTLLRFDTARVGTGLSNDGGRISVENKLNFVNVFFSNTDTSTSLRTVGELLQLQFTAKKREDTVSTKLLNASLFALNTDNLLDSVRYRLAGIAVLGVKIDHSSVFSSPNVNDFTVSPSITSGDMLTFSSFSEKSLRLKIYDALGRMVIEKEILKSVMFDASLFPSGIYRAVLESASDRRDFGLRSVSFMVVH